MHATRTIAALATLVALATGCATNADSDERPDDLPAAASGAADPTTVALDMMRRTYSARYQPFSSPAEMLRGVDAVVVGAIASVEPALEAGEGEPLGRVMVGVTVKEAWKPPSTHAVDDIFYYSFARPKDVDFDIYRKGLPLGTAVIVYGNRYPVRWVEGDPGVPVYAPFPQGLFIEVGGRLENVYAPGEEGWPAVSGTESSLEAATLS